MLETLSTEVAQESRLLSNGAEVAETSPMTCPPLLPVVSNITPPPLPHAAASGGLAAIFDLDIRAAILAIMVDMMVFGGDIITLGAFTPFGVLIAGVLGFIVYRIQRDWHGDDHNSALIKALIIGLLTAIPGPLTPLVAVPGGFLAIVKALRRKQR